MSGERYLLDTNALVALLQGHLGISELLADADWVGISVISQLEFLSFANLSTPDRHVFAQFVQRVNVIAVTSDDANLLDETIRLRMQARLKLPDAIIAASALRAGATLVSADTHFQDVPGLKCWTI